jgi:hypothetical protein
MFEYLLLGYITIDGQRFECSKTIKHSAKFVVGDILTVEDTRFVVREVTWYLHTRDLAFLELEAVETGGISREDVLELVPYVFDRVVSD